MEVEPPMKRLRAQNTLNMADLRETGKRVKEEARQLFQDKVDHVIMRLICVRGLVPHVIESPEWKELMGLLSDSYHPTSATTFADKHIPREAVYVREKQIKALRMINNLTLTFDGNTTRKPHSVYTVHATTPSRETYFLDAHEASDERHTTQWVTDKLLKTIRSVGEGNWGATCSDSTNVTKAGRRELVSIVGTMLDFCDAVHHLHNTIGDINKLPKLKFLMSMLKGIIKYFSKSTYSTTILRKERNLAGDDEPVKALEKIGKTRFRTYWTAANALDPCLPHIRNLVVAKSIKFKNTKIQGMFMNRASGKYSKFEQSILQYITIVAPIIRALWSLEAAHANASDVFIFWLAIIATLNDLFSKGPNVTGVPVSLACEVTAIINKQYHEFFTNEVYFVAFTLDPRYPNSDFLKKPTANATTIVIPALSQRTGQRTPLPYPHAYTRVKDFLKEKLQKDLAHYVANPDSVLATSIFKVLSAAEVASGLRHQLEAFWHGEWPFNQQVKDGNPLAWWESLQDHPHARVLAHLAIKIFSVLVNSMPDERTNSTITWFNSPTRGSQNAQTLVDMIQIGQWYGKHQNKDYVLSKYRPVVKFRNIEESMLQAVQTGSADDESVADIDGVADSDNEDEAEDKLLESEIDEHQPAQAVAFEIHPDIDINSKALKDMVSTDPVSVVSTVDLSSVLESPQAAMMVTDDGDADWNY
ncbi:ribonuclease H-like domain-containing protein [Suillus cothurnatus]|nr:ribonuclease H-like domain-containing protein [Suillus cothurnatus]